MKRLFQVNGQYFDNKAAAKVARGDRNSNGNYTYTRTDGSPLDATEVFEYTITDKDGDPASSTITITIADMMP